MTEAQQEQGGRTEQVDVAAPSAASCDPWHAKDWQLLKVGSCEIWKANSWLYLDSFIAGGLRHFAGGI